ncbi:MAG: hypothetical protein EOP34_08270 [Rickettsiales bacterium]|nr:MAG: hypothetical protein EOP34_08270 [Rickettsiales bacterium]
MLINCKMNVLHPIIEKYKALPYNEYKQKTIHFCKNLIYQNNLTIDYLTAQNNLTTQQLQSRYTELYGNVFDLRFFDDCKDNNSLHILYLQSEICKYNNLLYDLLNT